jgi:alkylresorcinol/alkylpyrone synthase
VIHTNKRDASLCSRILAIGRATPAYRVSQEESFRISRYERDGVRRVFLNSGIDFRHFYFEHEPRLDETADELNARYLRGAVETGCRAVRTCLDLAGLSPRDVDLLVVCTSTGYVCPDIGTRLIGHMGFRNDVRRASMIGWVARGRSPVFSRPSISRTRTSVSSR